MTENFPQIVENLYRGFFHRKPTPNDLQHHVKSLDNGLSIDKLISDFMTTKEFANVCDKMKKTFVPPGHFYSPIVNVDDLSEFLNTPKVTTSLPGITISVDKHIAVWNDLLPFLRDMPFPEEKSQDYYYFFQNPAFSYGDASILHAMLRLHRPKRLVEVGSGYSSACSIDTIERYLGGDTDVSFVEPYPELLNRLIGKFPSTKYEIHASAVQKVDTGLFEKLKKNDFLFIDSTHVMKTGSDVCHELFDILPKLNQGVIIHFHDVFWPFEYKTEWIRENRSWNEIYGLRAFLMYNNAFEIVFHNDFFTKNCRNIIETDYPTMLKNSGGSIWLRKVR